MENEQIIPVGTTIELPYTRDSKTGSPVRIQIPQDMSESQVQEFVNTNFPRTMGSMALQASEAGADPLSREEYELLKKSGGEKVIQEDRAKAKSNIASIAGGLWRTLNDVADGAFELLSIAGETAFPIETDWSPQSAATPSSYPGLKVQAAKVLEGFARGSQDLMNMGSLGITAALEKVGLADEYDRYELLKKIERDELQRKAGGTAIISEQFAKENPEIAQSAEKLSNVLDFSLLVPGLGLFGKAGEVGLGRKTLSKAMEVGGAVAEMPARVAGNIAESITSEGVKVGGITALTGALGAKAVATGAAIGGLGSIGGKLSRYAGMLLGSEEAASKIIAQALESETGPLSRMMLNGLAKFVPDGSVRVARSVVDSGIDALSVGGAMGYIRASSDPFNTGYDIATQTLTSGLGAGIVGAGMGGMVGAGREITGAARKEAYIREIASDLSERPESKTVTEKGIEFSVPDEKLNREKVASAEDMTPEQKMALFGVLGSAERSGMDVVFVNDSTKLPEALGGSGAGMGAGVSIAGTEKPTIIINSDRVNGPKAIEEVVHATISKSNATHTVNELLIDSMQAGQSLDSAFEKIKPFAESYITETKANDPARAEALQRQLDSALDPNKDAAERIKAITPMAEEYIAKGVAEVLSGVRPEQLMTGRGNNVVSNTINTALNKIFSAIETPASGASLDPISGHFYKDGKLVADPVITKLADAISGKLKQAEGLNSPILPGDVTPDGGKVVAGPEVMKADARPLYEDLNADGTPTSPKQKTEIHYKVYESIASALGESTVDPALAAAGVYSGNIKKGVIVSNRNLSNEQLARLFEVKAPNGNLIIDPKDRASVERWNQASGDSHLVNIVNDVSTSKSRGGDRRYFRRASVVLPLGFQATKGKTGGGLVMPYFNMSLLHEVTNHQRGLTKVIDKALSDFGINKTEDWAPIVKRYIENLSSDSRVPSADAVASLAPKGVSLESAKAIRDLIHLSGSGPRKGEARVNEPTISLRQLPSEVISSVVDVYGKKTGEAVLARDRNAFAHIRADSLRDVSLFQPNGIPVKIDINLQNAMPLIRANFSPGKNLRREKIGASEVLLDEVSKQRIIANDKGATLFEEGKPARKFQSIEEAKDFANRNNKPEVARSQRTFFTDKEREQMRQNLMYSDIKGSKADQEIRVIHRAIREANRAPGDLPSWVEGKEFRAENERKVETEIRRRQKMRKAMQDESSAFRYEQLVEQERAKAEPATTKRERVQAPSAVLESAAAAEVPSKPKLKITEITPATPTQKKQPIKSLADLEIAGLPKEKTETPAPAKRGEAVNLLGEKQYHYTAKMQAADAKVVQAKADFLTKLAGWEKEAKQRLSEMKPDDKPKAKVAQETAAKVEEIPVDMEPEPPKSGSSEMPETQIPNVATAADDARVPRDFAIKKSASRKFSVYTIGSSAVQAVADSYREALLLAHKKRNEKLKRK